MPRSTRRLATLLLALLTVAGSAAGYSTAQPGPQRSPLPQQAARSQAAQPQVEPPPGAASYAYDALGRLTGVVAADGSVVRYRYDAAGNTTGVERLGTPAVAVLSAVPGRVRPGDSVTVTGKGFTATGTSARFNGTPGTVTSATPDRLVVTVPEGAGSGPLSVTSPNGTAALDGVVVIGDDRPALADFTPRTALSGAAVTLTVANTDPGFANNLVRVNGLLAPVTARTDTSLTVTVPPGAASGPVTFSTPAGTATSAGVLVVPPAGVAPENIDSTAGIPVDTATQVAVPAGKYALRHFPAADGERFAVTLTGGTFGSCNLEARAYDERNRQTGSASCPGTSGWIETGPATGPGLRTIVLRNTSANAGTISVTVHKVPADLDAGLQPLDGTPKPVTTTHPGRNAFTTFAGTAGQRVLIQTTGTSSSFGCCDLDWWLAAPDGTRVGNAKYNNNTLDTTTLPQTGTYRIRVDPARGLTGGTTVSAWNVPDDLDAGAQALDGTARTVTTANPGQNAYTTFTGTTGQRVIVQTTGTSSSFGCCDLDWWLAAPDGTRVGNAKYNNNTLDTIALPQDGTYRLVFNPAAALVGGTTVKAWTVPADLDAGAQPTDGTGKTVTFANPGQNAYTTFSGTTGQRVLIQTSGTSSSFGCCDLDWWLAAPDGTRVGSAKYNNNTLDTIALPQDGTYRVHFNPASTLVGSTTAKVWTVPADADAGAQPTDGTGKTVTFANPGQNAYTTFSGTTGQRVLIQTSGTSSSFGCCDLDWWLAAPDGARVGGAKYNNNTLDTIALPQDGTYRIDLNPAAALTGSTTIKAWTVPADLDAGAQPTDGTGKTVTFANPGQNAYTTFSGTTGQRVLIQTSGTSSSFGCCDLDWQLTAPNGARVGSAKYNNNTLDTIALPQDGTYRIDLNPAAALTGSTTIKAWTVPADLDAGAQPTDGTGKTVTFANPGQNAYTTFSGTTGQRVLIQTSGTSSSFGCCDLDWQLTAPNGARVGSAKYNNNTLDTIALPQDGTYRIDLNPAAALTGGTTVKTWTVPNDLDLGTLPLNGTATPVTFTNPGQDAYAIFTGAANQRVVIQSSGTSSSFGCCDLDWQLNGPSGARIGAAKYGNSTLDVTLPSAGAYRLVVMPTGALLGSVTFTASLPAGAATATTEVTEPQAQAQAQAQAQVRFPRPRKPDDAPHVDDPRPAKTEPGRVPADLRSPNAATPDAAPEPDLDPAWSPDQGNLDGVDWSTRRAAPAPVQDLVAPPGTTAVSGHVRDLDGAPLAGIPVRVDSVRTTTDAQGRFLLADVRENATTVVVDGYAAGKVKFGTFRIRARITAGTTTPLDATVWLPRLDMRNTVEIGAPTTEETVLTTPDVPGLEVRVPAGSVVRDQDGNVVRELGITAIPVDRPPYPLPRNGIVPTYFTVQPGGTSIFPDGASVVYPNYTDLPPGTEVDFWNYDPTDKGWYVYGKGRVNDDGTRVVPDEKTRLWTLDGAMFNTPGNPKPDKPWWQDLIDKLSGDPVDLSTGLLTDAHTDLGLNDTLPIALTRQYWQGDGKVREFGLNSGADFNMFLASEQQYQEVDLYTPGGGRAHYVRTSPGTGYGDAVFGAVGSPGRFTGSTIAQADGDWVLTLRDGTKYFFPWYARPRAMQDRNGNQVTFTRTGGANGEVTRITSPNGRWIALEYDATNRVSRARDNIGRTTAYTYDAAGRLATVTDVAGKVTTYAYDGANRITRITDARGVAYLDVAYDANGRVRRQDLADGGTFHFAYTLDAAGAITETRVTQPNGSVRRVVFDANHMVASDTAAHGTPLARTTTYVRGPDNRVDAVVDPYGRRTEYTYDAGGRITAITGLAGTGDAFTSGTAAYGTFDRPTSTTDADGATTTYTYDAKGNPLTATDPAGRVTTTTWTSSGQVATVTDPGGAVTRFTYEAGGAVTATDPLGRTAKHFVDAAGRLAQETDPSGAATLTAYDALDQPVAVTDALGGVSRFGYDDGGNLTSYTDQRGKVTRWSYDGQDRPVSTTDPLGRTATTTYDAAGRPTASVTRSGKRTETAYDALDRPTGTRFGVTGASAQESQLTYTYDALDRLAVLEDSAGGTLTHAYDARDRLVAVTGPNGTVGRGYDAAGRQTSTSVAGLPDTTYSYDASGAFTGVSRGGDTTTATRDAAGRVAVLTLPGGWTQTYTHDAAGQVTGIAYAHQGTPKGGIGYTYDASGRRTSVTGSLAGVALPAARADLTYDDANRLTSAGGTALTYDADGNLTGDGTTTYTWNARGRLTGTSRVGLTAAFAYDAAGTRTTRAVGGVTTRFVTDGANAVAELDAAGAVTGSLLSAGTDQWFARTAAGVTDTTLTDALGSPVALGRADGTTAATTAYDPFGVPTTTGDRRGSDLAFTGRQDDGTGLSHHRARYYSPALQRFISEDPIGIAGGTNLYAYAANSPTNLTDPSGHNPLLVGCLVGGLLEGGMNYAGQRLSGRKVDWGWGGVGGAAAGGCAMGALGGALSGLGKASKAMPPFPNALTQGRNAEAGVDVYRGIRNGDSVYSGITNNVSRRAGEHAGKAFDHLETVTRNGSVTRGEARAIEQALISRHKGENKINSISPKHPYYDQAVNWGEAWLNRNGYPR
ncbi:RHS repeat-associated core domain-containing protein [Saccharothrix yanglingensis]|uniref:RHS repeat-associated core domain-containing protein n=1 Tax=Saccharothrix yanglingensis TaxID=659496 RepID=UPI0027D33847|nr:RHS repeat-associated core domain-containing protein [Saccharothrix yanglingensis]